MLNKVYLTPEQLTAVDGLRTTLEADAKKLHTDIAVAAKEQIDLRAAIAAKVATNKVADPEQLEKLEKVKEAQFQRGKELEGVNSQLEQLRYEISEGPVTREDFNAMLNSLKAAQNPLPGRAGFPEDELASNKAGNATKTDAPTLLEALGGFIYGVSNGGSMERFFTDARKEISFTAYYGQHPQLAQASHYLDVTSKDKATAIKEAFKSGFATAPGMPNFPFGGSAGNLGAFCGWQHLDLNALLPFPDNCVANMFTRLHRPGISWFSFDRQITSANAFAPVAQSIVAGTVFSQSANKPFVDYGFLTLQVPLVEIAGIYTVSNMALRSCAGVIDRLKETAAKQFLEREALQALSGTGAAPPTPQLMGLFNQPGITTHTFRGAPYNQAADQIPDAIAEAITSAVILGCQPDTLIIHPNDQLRVSTVKDTEGRPLYVNGCTKETFCLENVCATPYTTQGISLVTNRSNIYLVDDGEIRMSMGYMNDDFRQNVQRIRWERAVATAVSRPECVIRTSGLV